MVLPSIKWIGRNGPGRIEHPVIRSTGEIPSHAMPRLRAQSPRRCIDTRLKLYPKWRSLQDWDNRLGMFTEKREVAASDKLIEVMRDARKRALQAA